MKVTMNDDVSKHATVESGDHRSRRWWLDIRWITAGVVAASVAFMAWGFFGPEPPLRVSRETTFITEPLAADGLPDYAAAWVAMSGPAPPPEENLAVAVLKRCRGDALDPSYAPVVCGALGISTDLVEDRLVDPTSDASTMVSREAFKAACEQPWTAKDIPELDDWLRKNEPMIDRFVEASRLPGYWLPSSSMWGFRDRLPVFSGIEPELRRGSEILKCRSLWHVGHGRYAEAWRDLHAIARLSRLIAAAERRPLDFRTFSTALGMQDYVDHVMTHALLAKPGISRDLLATMARDLDSLGPLPAASTVVLAERLGIMGYVVPLVLRSPRGRGDRAKLYDGIDVGTGSSIFGWSSIDWNHVLKRLNAAYDEVDAIFLSPGYRERQEKFEHFHDALRREHDAWKQGSRRAMALLNRGYRSDLVANAIERHVMIDFGSVLAMLTRSRAQVVLARTAVALAEWKLDHEPDGPCYPDRLEALVPRYLPAVPLDPFADAPLIYERRGDGYLLASVGQNGVYDGGLDMRGWIAGGEWHDTPQKVVRDKCDHVIRMPMPDRPFIQPVVP